MGNTFRSYESRGVWVPPSVRVRLSVLAWVMVTGSWD